MKTVLLLLIPLLAFPQWKYKSGGNQFDGKYKSSWVIGKGGEYPYNNPQIHINKFEKSGLNFYITSIGYVGCDNNTLEFVFNDSEKIYETKDFSLDNEKKTLFIESINDIHLMDFYRMLMEKSKLYVRFTNDCNKDDYIFSLSGSTKAIKYVLGNELDKHNTYLDGERIIKNELSEYYDNLKCGDSLDLVKPILVRNMDKSSFMFNTSKGRNYFKNKSLIKVYNSYNSPLRFKIVTKSGGMVEEYYMDGKSLNSILKSDKIDIAEIGLISYESRMKLCK